MILGPPKKQIHDLEERLSKSANRVEISKSSRILLESTIDLQNNTSIELNCTSDLHTLLELKNENNNIDRKNTDHAKHSELYDEFPDIFNQADQPTVLICSDSLVIFPVLKTYYFIYKKNDDKYRLKRRIYC